MKGILFKPWKIKAIADSSPEFEWQTRRVMKPQPIQSVSELKEHSDFKGYWIPYALDRRMVNNNQGSRKNDCGYYPKYQVGDIVYIKEAWRYFAGEEYEHQHDIRDVFYKLTEPNCDRNWHSPLFMPEWAARYFLKITDVRPERLTLPLSPEDLVAEGGEQALEILSQQIGKWHFVYSFKKVNHKEE